MNFRPYPNTAPARSGRRTGNAPADIAAIIIEDHLSFGTERNLRQPTA
jgi:hypothetical protein